MKNYDKIRQLLKDYGVEGFLYMSDIDNLNTSSPKNLDIDLQKFVKNNDGIVQKSLQMVLLQNIIDELKK